MNARSAAAVVALVLATGGLAGVATANEPISDRRTVGDHWIYVFNMTRSNGVLNDTPHLRIHVLEAAPHSWNGALVDAVRIETRIEWNSTHAQQSSVIDGWQRLSDGATLRTVSFTNNTEDMIGAGKHLYMEDVFAPPCPQARRPGALNETWSFQCPYTRKASTQSGGGYPGELTRVRNETVRVVNRSVVDVPAGTFDVFTSVHEVDDGGSRSASLSDYAPAVCNNVRLVSDGAVFELVAYSCAAATAASAAASAPIPGAGFGALLAALGALALSIRRRTRG